VDAKEKRASSAHETSGRPLLFDWYPQLRDELPFRALADGAPTPVEPLTGLAREWGLEQLLVKRDDLTSSLYGGNKVRKLEWVLAAIQREGRRSVITTGAWGSHHALATAIFARELGLRASLVLFPQPPTAHVRANLLADMAAGARIVQAFSVATVPAALLRGSMAAQRAGEGWPARVPVGGSDERGTLGYVEAAIELAGQVERGECPAPRYVYVAAGTCGTGAGLALGLRLAAERVPALRETVVVATRVVPAVMANSLQTRKLIRGAAKLLRRAGAALPALHGVRVEFLGGHLGRGYGHPTEEAEAAKRSAADLDGLRVDSTYTAKALAGLRAFATATPERRSAVHLYVHSLGDRPAFAQGAGEDAQLPRALRRLGNT